MSTDPHLMSIGEFSSLSRISIRMLRHYDEHDVLAPASVDNATGYRRYSVDQLAAASLIRQLRDLGFGVAAISALLPVHGTPAFARALHLQRGSLVVDLQTAEQRVHLIDHMINSLKGSTMPTINVRRTTIPAMTIATVRGVIPHYSAEGQLWSILMPEIASQQLTPIGPGGAIEHDPSYVESDPDISVWLPVPPGTTAHEPVTIVDLPPQEVVLAEVTGPYDQISSAHDQIGGYMTSHNLRDAPAGDDDHTGQVINVYLNIPGEVPDDELRTDVLRPTKSA